MWYYLESKKNFCPRLSAPIMNIFTNEDETIFFLILEDNSIEVIKSANFLEITSFKFITNPSINDTLENTKDSLFFKTGITQHPSQSFSYF